jgi:hypothetical protein
MANHSWRRLLELHRKHLDRSTHSQRSLKMVSRIPPRARSILQFPKSRYLRQVGSAPFGLASNSNLSDFPKLPNVLIGELPLIPCGSRRSRIFSLPNSQSQNVLGDTEHSSNFACGVNTSNRWLGLWNSDAHCLGEAVDPLASRFLARGLFPGPVGRFDCITGNYATSHGRSCPFKMAILSSRLLPQ